MTVQISECPLCGEHNLKYHSSWNQPGDHRTFVKCSRCSHIFAAKFDPEELGRLYREDYYSSPDDPGIQNWIDQNRVFWQETVQDIFRFRKTFASILDYGAGTGGFLEQFQQAISGNVKIFAVESSGAAMENLRNRFPGAEVYPLLEDCPERHFDCISVLQCFEHLTNPAEICRELHSRLNSGGIMIVTVPNRYSLRTVFKGKNDSFNPGNPTHLQFFTASGMENMLKQSGFRQVYRLTNYPVHGNFLKKPVTFLFRKLGISSELRFICIAD